MLLFYFWLHWVLAAACRLSPVVAQWLQLPRSRVQAQQLRCTGLVYPWYVDSLQARD